MRTTTARFKRWHASPPTLTPLLTLEIAHTTGELRTGLMGRSLLPPLQGMLFVFDALGYWGFWMKDTGIPLDLAWLSSAGVVQTIVQLNPYDETMRTPGNKVKYAIELPAGTFKQYDLRIGDQLVLGVTT